MLLTEDAGGSAVGREEEEKDPKRPSLSLKATPGTGMVPVRVSATAEFKGGYAISEYYCPSIQWSGGTGRYQNRRTTAIPMSRESLKSAGAIHKPHL